MNAPVKSNGASLPSAADALLAVAEEQAFQSSRSRRPVLVRLPTRDYWSDGMRVGLSYLRVVWEDGAYQYAYLDGYSGGRPSAQSGGTPAQDTQRKADYKTADDVKNAVKSGSLSKEQALGVLRKKFGYK